ncbi:MAG: potassium/hydrogen antiporter [Solirubrobacteraceae bacterium]|nr:potassium/hydrogen antiporter [Solirubrobacteraceae bacterium]
MADGQLILVVGALLTAGLLASLAAGRLGIPGLVLFLGLGMAVGSDGAGWLEFDDYGLARSVGIVALALILFEGGLTTGVGEIRPVLWPAVSLAILGTLGTAVITGLAAAWLFDFSTLEGLLLGSVVASTDGAAIFALLRGSTLRRKLARTLEGEAGLNDPVAVLLVVGFIAWIQRPGYGLADMAGLFAQQVGIGLAVGVGVGWLAVQGFRRVALATAGLYPVAAIATAALAYGGAASLDGSGFLAVYLAGLALGSAAIPARQTVAAFHQGLAWVAQLTLFVVLGLLVFPHQLPGVAVEGAALALVLALVARPVAVGLATAFAGYSRRERVVLGWAGLRGAVPVVLATFPVLAGVPRSLEFFNIVFFAVLLSTIVQGTTFQPLARRLGLTTNEPALPRPLTEAGTIRRLGAEILEYTVAGDDAIAGARISDLGLPRDAVVNVIVRGEEAIPPRGSTRLRVGDALHVLVRVESARAVHALTGRWHSGPLGPPPRPERQAFGRAPIFSVWPWEPGDGDPARPGEIRGQAIVLQLRIRRDAPGGLWVLADGRYAITGRLGAVGPHAALTRWAIRRLDFADPDERAWLQTVIGAVAADRHR